MLRRRTSRARVASLLVLTLVLALAAPAAQAHAATNGTIAGTVMRGNGGAMNNAVQYVYAWNGSFGTYQDSTSTASDGSWRVQVPAGSYRILNRGLNAAYAEGYWTPTGLVPLMSMGTTVTVSAGVTTTCDATVPLGASIVGTVTSEASGTGLVSMLVRPYFQNPNTGMWEAPYGAGTGTNGRFTVNTLLPGAWRFEVADTGAYLFRTRFWQNASIVDSATSIVLTEGQTRSGYDMTLKIDVTDHDIEGSDRIATAINASQDVFPGMASLHAVVITTGWNWPDALGGAALAGAVGAPVLLAPSAPATMPASLLIELARLQAVGATKAYILGGESVVGTGTQAQLGAMLGAGNVVRLGGTGRYDTSALIASQTIAVQGGAFDGTVMIATGGTYADALAGSPVAAKKGWPILLAEPDSTGGLSDRMTAFVDGKASKAVILGSPSAVSSRVESDLAGVLGAANVQRWQGPDRVATAIDIGEHATALGGIGWDGVGFTNAYRFPDALSGAPVLAANDTLLLLTPDSAALTPALSSKLHALAAGAVVRKVHFLGGPPALGEPARAALIDALD